MRLFWKLFFATMLISAGCLSVGGNMLIMSHLVSQLDHEAGIAHDYADIVCYRLANELQRTGTSGLRMADAAAAAAQELSFAVIDAEGQEIFSSLPEKPPRRPVSSLGDQHRYWITREIPDGRWMQALRPFYFDDVLYYVETGRDITYIFNVSDSYRMLGQVMFWTLLPATLITFCISRLLTRRIETLSRTSRALASGALSLRVPEDGADEIAALSVSFNRMADELQAQMAALQAEAESRERFVGAFSHELKTPLTSIIGYADLLRRRSLRPDERRVCAEYIFSEGKRLERLSMRMLALIVLRNQTLACVCVNMKPFLGELCATVLPQLTESSVTLHCDAEAGRVMLEPDLMKTVLLNLLDNARKSMDAGGVIHLRGEHVAGGYRVSIRDSGRGMTREELAHIREAFYMADKSRSRSQGGAGLGLAICDEILRLHGFSISFDSTPGIGTTVSIAMEEVRT